MKRYIQAAEDMVQKYRDGIISAEDAIMAIHGLNMDACADHTVNDKEVEEIFRRMIQFMDDIGANENDMDRILDDIYDKKTSVLLNTL